MKHLTDLKTHMFDESTINIVEVETDKGRSYAICIKHADPFNEETYFDLGQEIPKLYIDFVKVLTPREFLNIKDD